MKIKILLCMLPLCAALAHSADPLAKNGSFKQLMQQLELDYNALNHAILVQDFDGAANAAYRIAYHNKPPMSEKTKIIAGLRGEMGDFKEADDKVHALTIEVENAAKAKDMDKLLTLQSQMLNACMNCHVKFRAKVQSILK